MYHQFIGLEFLEGHNTRSLKLKHNKPRKPGRGGRVACESEKVVLSLEGGFYRTVKTHKASKEMSYVIEGERLRDSLEAVMNDCLDMIKCEYSKDNNSSGFIREID